MNANILKLRQIIPDLVKSICVLYMRDDEIFNKTATICHLSSNKKTISRNENTCILNGLRANTYILNNGFSWFHRETNLNPLIDEVKCLHNNHGINEINSDQQSRVYWLLKVNKSTSIYSTDLLIGITNQDDHPNKHIEDGSTIYYLFHWMIGKNSMIHAEQACMFYWSNRNRFYVDDEIFEEYGSKKYDNMAYYYRKRNGQSHDLLSLHLDLEQAKIKLVANGHDFEFRNVNIMKSPEIKYKLCVILDGYRGQSVEIIDFRMY